MENTVHYSYRSHPTAGRGYVREVYDNKPNLYVNLAVEYPQDL